MPSCQAFNCTNERGKCQKSFFRIPNPNKNAEQKRLCKQWITNLKNSKLSIDTFKYGDSKIVCEDHFTADCFERNVVAESLNFHPKRKRLIPNAVPTIVNTDTVSDRIKTAPAKRSSDQQVKRERAKIKDNLLDVKRRSSTRAADTSRTDTSELPDQERIEESIDCDPSLYTAPNESQCVSGNESSNIHPCGHPCFYCLQKSHTDQSVFTSDHIYAMNKYRTIGTNTCEQPTENFMTSTPIKKAVDTARDDEPSFDASFFSTDSNDDSKDVTFDENVFMENTYMSDDEEEIEEMDGDLHSSIVNENKLIVFESNLMEIINALTCSECNCPVDPSDTDKEYIGTMIKITAYCTGGHLVRKWTSQPLIGKMPAGNLLVSAATLFSGQTFTHISQFSQFMNLKFIGKTTYQTIQREVLMPVVSHAWNMMQEHIFTKIKSQNRYLRLAGDGRCDSPGFNTKYCTYSLIDLDTQQIVAFVTVQVTETGSSSKMEVEGFKRCMDFLLERGFEIKVLATDRHVQIRSVMSKQYPQTEHQFDVWHLANSIRKKLLAKSKSRGTEELGLWIKAVCNHLWWCANNCGGDKDWLEESWISLVHHVVDEHTFDGDLVTSCAHGELTTDERRKKKWLKKGSKAHNALKEVVLDKRLRKDIRHLSEFCHTGNLEVYHSLLTKYAPKRQEFDFDQMNCRTTIAVIDHNMGLNRGHKLDKDGKLMYKKVYSKVSSQWIPKAVYNPKNYLWMPMLMKMCVVQKEATTLPPVPVKDRGNIAPVPAPPTREMISKLISRFRKAYDDS